MRGAEDVGETAFVGFVEMACCDALVAGGVTLAPLAGKLIADVVLGEGLGFDLTLRSGAFGLKR